MAKFVIVKGKAGLANRLLCAVTGVLYARMTNRQLMVDWSDPLYSNDRANVFARYFHCPVASTADIPADARSVWPSVWAGRLGWSVNELLSKEAPDLVGEYTAYKRFSADVTVLDRDEDYVVLWAFSHQVARQRRLLTGPLSGMRSWSVDRILANTLQANFRMQPEVQRKALAIKQRCWSERVIGLHIRYTDRCFLGTPLAAYHKAVRSVLKERPGSRIFLATDNQDVQREFMLSYPGVIVQEKEFPPDNRPMHSDMSCSDRAARGVEALVDMHLLSQCDHLIYSSRGTFAHAAWLFSSITRSCTTDIDRRNPRVWLHHLVRRLVG